MPSGALSLFPALRVAIDQDRQNTGRFVLTGSSSPKLVRAISESLSGRIGIIEMALINEEIRQSHGNKSKAAKKMGMSREALRKKLIQTHKVLENLEENVPQSHKGLKKVG